MYTLETGRPVGYGLVGLVFLILGASVDVASGGFLLIVGAIFFVAQAIVGFRLKK